MRVDKLTGEIFPVRHDPDADLHFEGSGEEAYGTKYLLISTRSQEDRIILDIRHVRGGSGGEASVAVGPLAGLAPLAPGVQGVIWDMALRGMHIDRIMKELGWLTVTRVHAAQRRARKGQRGGHRVEKERLIEVKEVTLRDGRSVKISIYARAGAAGIAEMDDSGNRNFVPLRRVRTQRFGQPGRFRFYNQYQLPTKYGGGDVTLRLHGDIGDREKRLNRAENLRAIPPRDPDFDRIYQRRNDAESINRRIEDTLSRSRPQRWASPSRG